MKLKFTGRGAMLQPKEGNTAAYFESDNAFFLMDCGEDVAAKLIREKKLTKEKEYYLFLTHTHSDHIGSLGTLQQYLYWVCGKKLNIVTSSQMDYREEIQKILDGFGLVPGTYTFVDEKELDNQYPNFRSIRYVKTSHGDTPLASCAIVIHEETGNTLYTGDIADDTILREFICYNGAKNIDKIYVDVSLQKSPVHLSFEELVRVVPGELRSRIHCMHLNDDKLLELIEQNGFRVVRVQPDFTALSVEELTSLATTLEGELNQVQATLQEKQKIKEKKI